MLDFTIIREASGYALLAQDGTDRRRVVRIDRDKGQVYSVVPGDCPRFGNGYWYGRLDDEGVRYVSSSYSRSYANRIYRQLTQEVS